MTDCFLSNGKEKWQDLHLIDKGILQTEMSFHFLIHQIGGMDGEKNVTIRFPDLCNFLFWLGEMRTKQQYYGSKVFWMLILALLFWKYLFKFHQSSCNVYQHEVFLSWYLCQDGLACSISVASSFSYLLLSLFASYFCFQNMLSNFWLMYHTVKATVDLPFYTTCCVLFYLYHTDSLY